MQFNKVLVIGLGQLGLPAAKYVKEKGFEVFGFDTNAEAVNRAERIAGIKGARDFGDFDAYIICISTHSPEDIFSPNIEGVLSIADRISRETRKDGALVSIESNIPKGTSQKVFEILRHRLHVVHAPHRWYALEEKEHGVNQLRVIGGVDDCCLREGMHFYNKQPVENLNAASSSINLTTREPCLNSSIVTSNKSLEIPMHPISRIESFIVLGFFWIGHDNQFHYIKRVNRTLLWITIFYLMFIALIPFSTSLLGEYPEQQISVLIYGVNLIISLCWNYLHWWYATNGHRLVDSNLDLLLIRTVECRVTTK